MPVMKFSDSRRPYDAKEVKKQAIKVIASKAREAEAFITRSDGLVTKVHGVFSDSKRTFTKAQLKKTYLSLLDMYKQLGQHAKTLVSSLHYAVANDIPNTKLADEIEDVSALRTKIALLCTQIKASVAEGEEEEILTVDGNGYVVPPLENAVEELAPEASIAEDLDEASKKAVEAKKAQNPEPKPDDPAKKGEDDPPQDPVVPPIPAAGGDEVVPPIPDEASKTNADGDMQDELLAATAEEETPDVDLPAIELDEAGIDGALAEDILSEEELISEGDPDEVISAQAALKNKKIASSQKIVGKLTGDELLSGIMEEAFLN